MSVTSSTVSGGPVEFDPYSEDYFCAPFDTYRRMRDEAPVYYSEKYDFWALTRYDDVAAAIKDHGTFSSAKGVTLDIVKARGHGEPVGQDHHQFGSARARADAQAGQPGLHAAGGRVAGIIGPRNHRSLCEPTRSDVVRRGRRLRGAVPGRDHHVDARRARRRPAAAAAVARQGAGAPAEGIGMLGREHGRDDETGALLLRADSGAPRQARRTT